jgi:hypothetical protein
MGGGSDDAERTNLHARSVDFNPFEEHTMDDDTLIWKGTDKSSDERVELARRESDGITVELLWSRENDVLAVSVQDVRCGNFELVLGPNEPPLDVFHHPYAYAELRGLTVPQQPTTAPADSQPPSVQQLCVECGNALHLSRCAVCREHVRVGAAVGLVQLGVYLEKWAQFDHWSQAAESREVPVRVRRKPDDDDQS